MESRKMALMKLFARKEWRHRYRGWIYGHSGRGLCGMNGERSIQHICTILCKMDHWWEVGV